MTQFPIRTLITLAAMLGALACGGAPLGQQAYTLPLDAEWSGESARPDAVVLAPRATTAVEGQTDLFVGEPTPTPSPTPAGQTDFADEVQERFGPALAELDADNRDARTALVVAEPAR